MTIRENYHIKRHIMDYINACGYPMNMNIGKERECSLRFHMDLGCNYCKYNMFKGSVEDVDKLKPFAICAVTGILSRVLK